MGEFDEPTASVGIPVVARPAPGKDSRPCLVVYTGVDEGRVYPLEEQLTVFGRDDDVHVRLSDTGLSRRHAVITLQDDMVSISDLGSTNGTWVNGERVDHAVLQGGDHIQIGNHTLKLEWKDPADEAFALRQYSSTKRDTLTGCYNKRHLVELLRAELSFSTRHKKALSVVMVDIDHFKQLNDTHGHLAGDRVLAGVGELMRNALRQHDVVARFGGEEFVIVMRETSVDDAMLVSERLRTKVESMAFAHDGKELRVTFSAGVANYPTLDVKDSDALLEAADRALYRAKAAGRNRSAR